MYIKETPLKPLDGMELSAEDAIILKWLRNVTWEAVAGAREPIPYKAKVPEFYGGVRFYRLQAGGASAGSLGALELFIRKLGLQGVIGKQELYPVSGHGNQPRYLSLKKADLDNLGVGRQEEEE
jgi:hypothetical protein